jgi:hypothetical protein
MADRPRLRPTEWDLVIDGDGNARLRLAGSARVRGFVDFSPADVARLLSLLLNTAAVPDSPLTDDIVQTLIKLARDEFCSEVEKEVLSRVTRAMHDPE